MLTEGIFLSIVVIGAGFLLGRYQKDRAFTTAMVAYAVLISLAAILSLQDSIVGATWSTPYLLDSDGQGYFEQAQRLTREGITNFQTVIRSNYLGYQLFLAILFSIFGTHLAVGVTANLLLLLLSITCLHRATLLLTGSPRAALLATVAFMLTTVNVFYALVLLKEPALGLAFALVLLAVTKAITDHRIGFRAVLYFLIALAIIITMRATVLLFVLMLFAFVARILVKRRAHALVGLIAMLVLAVPVAQNFTIYDLNSEYITREVTANTVIVTRFEQGDLDISGIAGRVGGAYVRLPFAAKIALFPLPTAMQILLPFDFWNDQFLKDHFAMFPLRNLNLIWLLFIAPWCLFAVVSTRRTERPLLSRLLLTGVVYYIGVAIMYGGLIPRYGTPALFFIYPSIGFWWARSKENLQERARVARFFLHYYAFFTLAGLGYMTLQIML